MNWLTTYFPKKKKNQYLEDLIYCAIEYGVINSTQEVVGTTDDEKEDWLEFRLGASEPIHFPSRPDLRGWVDDFKVVFNDG